MRSVRRSIPDCSGWKLDLEPRLARFSAWWWRPLPLCYATVPRGAEAEPRVYRESKLVDPGDIDELGHVSNVAYVRWVQDIAKAHSAAVGWDYPRYLELGAVFVVRRHEIEYLRPTVAGQEVEIRTWIERWSAATSLRQTRVLAADGTEVVRAATSWALIATDSGRPLRIGTELIEAFRQTPVAAAPVAAGRPG